MQTSLCTNVPVWMCVAVCVLYVYVRTYVNLSSDNHLTDSGVRLLMEAMKKQVSETERGQGLLRLSVKVGPSAPLH